MTATPADILRRYWGYADFRPAQLDIILSVLSGHDTLGLLPTGGGKSVTFQVPAMMLPGLTLVVTPLISLMKDQVDNLHRAGIPARCIHTGLTPRENRLTLDKCENGACKLLYLSPEKLQGENFVNELRRMPVSLIVVDEAHCISQWGYDFRPSYLNLRHLREIFDDVPALALTASATPDVAADIRNRLAFKHGHNTYARSFARTNLSFVVRHDENKERTLLRVLDSTEGSAIVYVRSRRKTRDIAVMLQQCGISAEYYHAGLDAADKSERQNRWKAGQTRVMVATNAFGMGIDKADVRVVIHLDLPSSLEEYYQEAGRAGRDGQPAYAVVITAPRDRATLRRRISDSFPDREFIGKIYELAGVFCEVAVGDPATPVCQFNFDKFCERFKLPPVPTRSALTLLSRAGYLEYIDEVETKGRVHMLMNRSEIYSVEVDQSTEDLFWILSRTYTGLFADYVEISETRLAYENRMTEMQVVDALMSLSRAGVLHYIPRRKTPYIYWSRGREETRHVRMPLDVYERQRDRMSARIEAMERFVYDDTRCREQMMLEYFGESSDHECGMCDVCRARRIQKAEKPGELDQRVLDAVRQGTANISGLLEMWPSRRTEVAEAVRRLADRGALRMDCSAGTVRAV